MADIDALPTARSQAEAAYWHLEGMVVTLVLAPGSVHSEADLAARLGIGRTPVREALQRLEAEHLVEIMPRRGVRVSAIDVRGQLRLLETRRALETLVATSAARRATGAQRADLAGLHDGFLASGSRDYSAFLELDRRFNDALAAASDNEFAAAALRSLHGLSRRFWHFYQRRDDDLAAVARMHADIAGAVSRGDMEGAETAVHRHMDYIRRFTDQLLEAPR